jgi:methylamine dehydrogenase accessory protein MauD
MSGSVWVASYVLLWLAVVVLGLAVVALLRQVGVLHARLHPLGVHFGGEGPDVGTPAPTVAGLSYAAADLTLLAFTSPTCEVCALLKPSFEVIRRDYRDVQVAVVDLADVPATFDAFKVRSTPYLVAVDRAGSVRGRGVANSLEQVEELLEEARIP